jgi:hypothetical protein
MNVARIQIISHGSFKKRCILWDDRQTSPEIQQSDSAGVQLINAHVALRGLDDSEQCKRE